jgi:hypothetical protein
LFGHTIDRMLRRCRHLFADARFTLLGGDDSVEHT